MGRHFLNDPAPVPCQTHRMNKNEIPPSTQPRQQLPKSWAGRCGWTKSPARDIGPITFMSFELHPIHRGVCDLR